MATSSLIYTGNLRTKAVHQQSGVEIISDAPTDNNGLGQAFSPTDLLATSLASCMLTIMGINANANGMDIDGTKAEVTKVMAANPRRVSEVIIKLQFPKNSYTEKEKKMLEVAGRNCPVAKSLHPEIIQNIEFVWV